MDARPGEDQFKQDIDNVLEHVCHSNTDIEYGKISTYNKKILVKKTGVER